MTGTTYESERMVYHGKLQSPELQLVFRRYNLSISKGTLLGVPILGTIVYWGPPDYFGQLPHTC